MMNDRSWHRSYRPGGHSTLLVLSLVFVALIAQGCGEKKASTVQTTTSSVAGATANHAGASPTAPSNPAYIANLPTKAQEAIAQSQQK